jgi:tRNA dimethylallyltransferase
MESGSPPRLAEIAAHRREAGKNKIIVVLGPTASGKSDLAIKIAKKYSGEIISADSRQVYRGMDIGTGKVSGTWDTEREVFISENIPHYLIDVVEPNEDFNISHFKKLAEKTIKEILQRKKIPIICGGTGFWIKSIVDNVQFPEVRPDMKLRKKLGQKNVNELFEMLKKSDSERAKNIDAKNKVRLIRAIEIVTKLGSVPKKLKTTKYSFLQLGISVPNKILDEKIKKRLDERFDGGMIEEVENLHKNGVSWKRLEYFGLEYRWISQYLQNKISAKKMKNDLYFAIVHYAKRQMTWFKKDKRIKWIKDYKEAEKETEKFLK